MSKYTPLLGDSLISDEDLKALIWNTTQATGVYKEQELLDYYISDYFGDGIITDSSKAKELMHKFGILPIRLDDLNKIKKDFKGE